MRKGVAHYVENARAHTAALAESPATSDCKIGQRL
jgi:hypothetical protein